MLRRLSFSVLTLQRETNMAILHTRFLGPLLATACFPTPCPDGSLRDNAGDCVKVDPDDTAIVGTDTGGDSATDPDADTDTDTDTDTEPRDGTTEDRAAVDCKAILDDGFSKGDGVYWLDPDGSGALEMWCDMTMDGGGWTLIYKRGNASNDTPHACRADESDGVDAGGLADPAVGSTDRVCGPQRLLESARPTQLGCDFLRDDATLDAFVTYDLARDTPWSALTLSVTTSEYASDACSINGLPGELQGSDPYSLFTCVVERSEGLCNTTETTGLSCYYSLWHTTLDRGGPWTFPNAWDFAEERNGRCFMR